MTARTALPAAVKLVDTRARAPFKVVDLARATMAPTPARPLTRWHAWRGLPAEPTALEAMFDIGLAGGARRVVLEHRTTIADVRDRLEDACRLSGRDV
jgi:hypothetical protein